MKMWSEKIGDIVKVYYRGDVDEYSAYELRTYLDKLITSGAKSLELSLKYVDFMDSTGIGMLLGRYKKTSKLRIPFSVSDVNSQIDKIFKLSGIYTVIPLAR